MEGIIRKIIIGRDPKNAMAYYIGMRAGSGKVSTIILDEEKLYKYAKFRYLISGRRDILSNAMEVY